MTSFNLIETTVSGFNSANDTILGSFVKREKAHFPFELSRQFISAAQKDIPNISELYKEILNFLLNNFSKLSVRGKDDTNIDVNTIFGSPERSVAKQIQDDNLRLPIISITQIGDENDDDRRRFRPILNVESNWNSKTLRAERVLSLVPRPIKITYLINIWGEYLEDVDQIKEQIFSLFNPSMTIITKFSNKTCAFLNELGDQSAFVVPDREDRLLRKQFEIIVETYIPTKKFLYTNTGEIREFVFDEQITEPHPLIDPNLSNTSLSSIAFSGLLESTSGDTGTAYGDISFFYVPDSWQASASPMLIVFHAWNEDVYPSTGNTILANTTFLQEAQNRGWYLLAPNGQNGPTTPDITSRRNRGNVASMENAKRSIKHMIDTYNVDPNRIYAVSFSHNAQAALYAARYLNPNDGLIAAAIVHTGGTSARFMHYSDSNATNELRFMAGGHANPDYFVGTGQFWSSVSALTPEQDQFDYDQVSLICIDQTTSSYAYQTSSLATNLKHVNLMCYVLSNEPFGTSYLASSTYLLWDYTKNQKGYPNKTLVMSANSLHNWSSLDETFACDFLASSVLSYPSAGSYVADKDGRWLNFGITRDASGWAQFSFTINLTSNQLTMFGLSNVDVLDIYMDDIGFNTLTRFKIFSSVKTRLFNWPSLPQSLTYQGNNAYNPYNWTYDPDNQILTLIPIDTNSIKTWIIN